MCTHEFWVHFLTWSAVFSIGPGSAYEGSDEVHFVYDVDEGDPVPVPGIYKDDDRAVGRYLESLGQSDDTSGIFTDQPIGYEIRAVHG